MYLNIHNQILFGISQIIPLTLWPFMLFCLWFADPNWSIDCSCHSFWWALLRSQWNRDALWHSRLRH